MVGGDSENGTSLLRLFHLAEEKKVRAAWSVRVLQIPVPTTPPIS